MATAEEYATSDELVARVRELEAEIASLREENTRLRLRPAPRKSTKN